MVRVESLGSIGQFLIDGDFAAEPEIPTITGYATGDSLIAGDAVIMTCESCGVNPDPIVFWENGGSTFMQTRSKDANGCTRSIYTIDPLLASHNDQIYACKVTNGV